MTQKKSVEYNGVYIIIYLETSSHFVCEVYCNEPETLNWQLSFILMSQIHTFFTEGLGGDRHICFFFYLFYILFYTLFDTNE